MAFLGTSPQSLNNWKSGKKTTNKHSSQTMPRTNTKPLWGGVVMWCGQMYPPIMLLRVCCWIKPCVLHPPFQLSTQQVILQLCCFIWYLPYVRFSEVQILLLKVCQRPFFSFFFFSWCFFCFQGSYFLLLRRKLLNSFFPYVFTSEDSYF